MKLTSIYCNHFWSSEAFLGISELEKCYFFYQIPLFVTQPFNRTQNEESARKWRYHLFQRIAFLTKNRTLLTAHTNSDQVESFFMNFIRGSGIRGSISLTAQRENKLMKNLCFPIARKSPHFLSEASISYLIITIIHPLILLNRFEISLFQNYLKLPVWTDQTNFQISFLRNRIRYVLLPFFRFYYNPRVDLIILRFRQTLIQENVFTATVTFKSLYYFTKLNKKSRMIHIKFNAFCTLPVLIQKEILINSWKQIYQAKLSFLAIQKILTIVAICQQTKKSQFVFINTKIFVIYSKNTLNICFIGSDGI